MTSDNLFKREEGVLARAQALIDSGAKDSNLAEEYAFLLKEYKKLFNQARRMVKISDMMQKELNDLNEKLSDLSARDGLTGIANRRRFDERLDLEWKRAARNGHPLSLVMADIDYFKRYNDHYGHAAGDRCLKETASALARSFRRPGEILARYGGEEFVGVLPGIDLAEAETIASNTLARIRALNMEHADSLISDRVTLSIGVAAIRDSWKDKTPAMLVEAADKFLYQAKSQGRDRMVSGLA